MLTTIDNVKHKTNTSIGRWMVGCASTPIPTYAAEYNIICILLYYFSFDRPKIIKIIFSNSEYLWKVLTLNTVRLKTVRNLYYDLLLSVQVRNIQYYCIYKTFNTCIGTIANQ